MYIFTFGEENNLLRDNDIPVKAASSDFGWGVKKVNKFLIRLTEDEFEFDGIKFCPSIIDKTNCVIAMTKGCESTDVYLGDTNEWSNDTYLGFHRISCRVLSELINVGTTGRKYRKYVPILKISIY